jgi:uncharacterized membrane protein YtjA (UPF0391 family)
MAPIGGGASYTGGRRGQARGSRPRHKTVRGRTVGGAGRFPDRETPTRRLRSMLKWAFIFLLVAIVAAIFGFGGIAATAAGIAKILFFIFLIIFVICLVMGLMAGRKVL